MNESQINDALFRHAFIVAMIVGTLCRFFVLRVQDKQYPSQPQDYIEQIIVAALASSLGAVALPALLDKEFSALTFLAVGIQEFQGLAQQEKITLNNIDGDDIVDRGGAYIDEIATTYEVRSYISLFSSLIASIIYIYVSKSFDASILVCIIFASLGGAIVGLIFKRILRRDSINDICDVHMAKISFDNSWLKVNDVEMQNIGLKESRQKYLEKGMAIELVPKDMSAFGIINDIGQQKAILHNIYIHFGMAKDVDERDLLSIAKTDIKEKTVLMITIPLIKDEVEFMKVAGSTPVLDTSKGKQSAYKKKPVIFK
ncbi:YIEGIA domain-containing protein [Terrisporobacter sp.]